MKYFELLNNCIEPLVVKERKEIIETIKAVVGISTDKTAITWFNDFMHLLRSLDTTNPLYFEPCRKRLKISEDMLNVYQKMAHFVLSEEYISRNREADFGEVEIGHMSYRYKIPPLFMPILVSFIRAIKKREAAKKPIAAFFENMDSWIAKYPLNDISKKYSCKDTEALIGIYRDWMTTYLGRNYFIHFEELLDECAETETERTLLKDATIQLTSNAAPAIWFNRIPSEPDMEELDRLLMDYKSNLVEEKEKQGGKSLYKDWEAFYPQSERICTEEIHSQFKSALEESSSQIKNFIEQEHKLESPHVIAVGNLEKLDALERQLANSIKDTQVAIDAKIKTYYEGLSPTRKPPQIAEDFALQALYDSNQLRFNPDNTRQKKEELSNIYQHSMEDAANSIKKFFKDVRNASGDNTSRFSAGTTDRFSKKIWITEEIDQIFRNTTETLNEKKLWKSFPSLYQAITPYIYQIGYPCGTEIPLPSDSIQSTEGTSAENRMD